MLHQMKLKTSLFEKIKNSSKSIKLWLNNEKRQRVQISLPKIWISFIPANKDEEFFFTFPAFFDIIKLKKLQGAIFRDFS